MINYLYAGLGQPLRKVVAAAGNVPDTPDNFTIPNNGYTESIAAHGCVELTFGMSFAGAAAGSVDIEASPTADFAVSSVQETIPVNGVVANWSPNQYLTGFFRIKNKSGQNMLAYAQKRLS